MTFTDSTYDFRKWAAEVAQAVEAVGHLVEQYDGEPAAGDDLAQVAALQPPASFLAYGRQLNGFSRVWQSPHDSDLGGCINLQAVQEVFMGSWEGIIYFDDISPSDPRLVNFRPVDAFSDAGYVGVFLDKCKSSELYLYDVNEDGPFPTGVDLLGYLELLRLTLGVSNWPWMLRELASPAGQARPFQAPAGGYTEDLTGQIAQVNPGFTLASFVQRYDAVRLPASQTWAASHEITAA